MSEDVPKYIFHNNNAKIHQVKLGKIGHNRVLSLTPLIVFLMCWSRLYTAYPKKVTLLY